MAARERWVAEASEVLGAPVVVAVRLWRRRRAATVVDVAGAVVLAAVVFLQVTGKLPDEPTMVYTARRAPAA